MTSTVDFSTLYGACFFEYFSLSPNCRSSWKLYSKFALCFRTWLSTFHICIVNIHTFTQWEFLSFFFFHGATAPKSQDRLKRLLPDGSTGGLVVSKALSLNLNFSFLNRISLLLISSSCLVVLTWLNGSRSGSYIPRKFVWFNRELNLGPRGW